MVDIESWSGGVVVGVEWCRAVMEWKTALFPPSDWLLTADKIIDEQ